ncbi:MAG: hydrolase, partial [Planctomycetes bacterium]|nr:hydrolase [Planctomycetota bacterium]
MRRLIRRRTEEARWASPDPRIAFFWVANAGTLHGLEGLEQGLGVDLLPFAVGRVTRDHRSDSSGEDLRAGADLFWKITPNTKLSLSLNTDFAETEVDERRVNLTRFPLFFPERRDFFLEHSGVFQFGGSTDVIPFFSRRIGLDCNREKVPIDAAAKLTGQPDGWNFGVLDAQTGAGATEPSRNLFAGRVSRNILEQSHVGVIWSR